MPSDWPQQSVPTRSRRPPPATAAFYDASCFDGQTSSLASTILPCVSVSEREVKRLGEVGVSTLKEPEASGQGSRVPAGIP